MFEKQEPSRNILWRISSLGLMLMLVQVAAAQTRDTLPDEGVLPGAGVQPGVLPSEAELPGKRQAIAGAARPDDGLPGEDQIPGAAAAPVRMTPAPPILRLAFDGHTAPIRSLDISADRRTMVSGGSDKDLHVWSRTDVNASGWLHRRTIRWPVSRGLRGVIYAARVHNNRVAFAGYGAFGIMSEIRIADTNNGDLIQTLTSEGDFGIPILSLAWSPSDVPRLVSINMDGRVLDWSADPETGIWNAKMWVDVDEVTYGPQIARDLMKSEYRGFADVSFLGERFLIIPKLDRDSEAAERVWHLERINLETGERDTLDQFDHRYHVRCIATTHDGRMMATVERGGEDGAQVGLWKFDNEGSVTSFERIRPSKPPIHARLDSSGQRLVLGTEIFDKQESAIEVWDLTSTPPTRICTQALQDPVYSVALDRSRKQLIATKTNAIQVYSVDENAKLTDEPPVELRPQVEPVLKVAFEKGDGYRFGFGWTRDLDGKKKIEGVFDLAESKLFGRSSSEDIEFLPTQRGATPWLVGGPYEGNRFLLFEQNEVRGGLPLDEILHGRPTTTATLPAPLKGNEDPGSIRATGAVVVGSSGEGNIYVYRADASDPPKLLRQFRGHAADVLSVSSSHDGRYLVSGSADSTMAVWNLEGVFEASERMNRWGAEFAIEKDQLLVTEIDEAGPFFFRGVRQGDQLALMSWVSRDATKSFESTPEGMLQRLGDLPFDIQPTFEFLRLGRPGPKFQSYAAWRPLARLFVGQDREWAYWTPAGFYDASFNGHQQFGWQINPTRVDGPVQYFRAAQFRKQLERPDVMRRLLDTGSLPAAMRETVTQIGPPPAEGAIVNQIETRPVIRLVSPDIKQVVRGDRMSVVAKITLPTGATLVEPKAFVSGVPAINGRVTAEESTTEGSVLTYQWQFRLPSDRQLQLEILAASQSESLGRLVVDLEHQPSDLPRPKPRLHVLAIGASRYRDPQIASLDFAAGAADQVLDLFRERSSDLYQISGDALTDADATRSLWRVFAQSAAEDLSRTVSPDDLVIMYLCGHGLRDRRTDQWYFVTADARYSDLMNDQYDDCISFRDLAALSKLPCRKLAILDSCHSGAVQPLMRRDDLKSALRFLQDDVVLTLTASEGDEEAAEDRNLRLGRFTAALVDALNGAAAELDADGTVSLGEVVEYVTERVARESEDDTVTQHPTATPLYLLRTLRIPLTTR